MVSPTDMVVLSPDTFYPQCGLRREQKYPIVDKNKFCKWETEIFLYFELAHS